MQSWAVKVQDNSGTSYENLPEVLIREARPSVDFGALVFRDANEEEVAFYGPTGWVDAHRYEEDEDSADVP